MTNAGFADGLPCHLRERPSHLLSFESCEHFYLQWVCSDFPCSACQTTPTMTWIDTRYEAKIRLDLCAHRPILDTTQRVVERVGEYHTWDRSCLFNSFFGSSSHVWGFDPQPNSVQLYSAEVERPACSRRVQHVQSCRQSSTILAHQSLRNHPRQSKIHIRLFYPKVDDGWSNLPISLLELCPP